MSLTRLLSRRGPVKDWFAGRLGHTETAMKRWKALGPPRLLPLAGPSMSSIVGTAFDYRYRLLFKALAANETIAARGAPTIFSSHKQLIRVADDGTHHAPAGAQFVDCGDGRYWFNERVGDDPWSRFANALDELASDGALVGRLLAPDDEALICRFCVVLAHFEVPARSGRVAPAITALGPDPSVEELLGLANGLMVEDLMALGSAFVDRLPGIWERECCLGPTFGGSTDVGGADADLIVDGVLIDIKVLAAGGEQRKLLWQLAGYLLLDYDDSYNIREVAFYLARHPELLAWPADDFLAEMAGGPVSRAVLRTELRAVLAEP